MSASSEYFAKVRALAQAALSTIDSTITDDNTLLLAVSYSWNHGDVTRPSTKGPIITFNVSRNQTTHYVERMEEVWLKKNVAEKFLSAHSQFLFLLVYFQVDYAFAYARMRPLESYKLSAHDAFRIDAKELKHVLTLSDDQERQILFDTDPAYKARMAGLQERKLKRELRLRTKRE